MTGEKGVDVVFDPVAGSLLETAFRSFGATFPFEKFRDAMELAAGRDGLGKTIVVVSEG